MSTLLCRRRTPPCDDGLSRQLTPQLLTLPPSRLRMHRSAKNCARRLPRAGRRFCLRRRQVRGFSAYNEGLVVAAQRFHYFKTVCLPRPSLPPRVLCLCFQLRLTRPPFPRRLPSPRAHSDTDEERSILNGGRESGGLQSGDVVAFAVSVCFF